MINNPIWYISVLLVCYITLYFCVWFAKRVNIKKEYLFIAVIVIGMMLIVGGIDWPILCGRTGRGFVAFFFRNIVGKILLFQRKEEIMDCSVCNRGNLSYVF